jgi:hypothetical protein
MHRDGVAQVEIHSQVASQGTGAVNVHDADRAVYRLTTSTSTAWAVALWKRLSTLRHERRV